MKNIKLFICVIIILLTVTSCTDVLNQNPTDQLSSETFWKDGNDASMGLTGIYNVMMGRQTFNHGRMLWDGLSDIAYSKAFPEIAAGVIEASSGNIVSGIYGDCYAGISRCNIFLANIDRCVMADSTKTTYKGEALFLRGYFYFILTEFYGGVPLYIAPVTVQEAKISQSSKAEVVNQIITDLDQAINYLPNRAYTGHAVKGSALALKAQVLMHNEKWTDAASAANELIKSGIFGLYSDYTKLFLTAGQDNNPEIIFSVRFLNPDQSCTASSTMCPDLIAAHSHYLSPTQAYVDSFECVDGLKIDQSPLYDPTSPFKNRDPRLSFTAINQVNFIAKASPLGETGESFITPFSCEKYVNWSNAPYSWSTKDDQDYVVLRYADVLLMYAECKNEISGPDQSVYDAVNLVRSRPSVNMPSLPKGLSKEEMRMRIRHERLVELGMEGLRYWDLKRWKTAETVIPKIQDPTGNYRKFDTSKNYLFPFPQSELDVNSNLKQNSGY